jgi:mercuric ion binding protein
VQRSLTKVGGVNKADVSLEKGEAVVSFDDTKTSVEALLKATKDAGYPSTLKRDRK